MSVRKLVFCVFFACSILLVSPVHAATQKIVLQSGWNLISLQIGDVWTISDFAEAMDVSDNLCAIWGYDASQGSWTTWQANIPELANNLTTIEAGRGYWVKVSNSCVLTLDGVPWEGVVPLVPGWNLIGFSGLEEIPLKDIFGTNWDNIQQVWTYDTSIGGIFKGYDITALPRLSDVSSVMPGCGYWVYALEDILIVSEPEILLIADVDAPPIQPLVEYAGVENKFMGRRIKYAGAEDDATDLNNNGIIDDAWTQDSIYYPIGVDLKPVIIGNTGNGALNWSIVENVSWLSIDGLDSGVVSSSKAYTYLKVDRSGLNPGTYTSSDIWVRAGELEKRITVSIDVPTAAGDFKGYAIAETVNGKDIALGKVDLGLSIFMESERTDEARIRVVIDRERSLLFPKDVFMDGVFYSDNLFSLSTTFVMPAGDRNAPPFDTFTHEDNDESNGGHGDRDWNGNGVLDNENPFPYDIRRGISLVGERIDENTFVGSYTETLQGMLPGDEKITIEGTFSLSRQSFTPTRRSIYNGSNEEMQIIGTSGITAIEKTIVVEDKVRIQSVEVKLDIDFPRPDLVFIELISPFGVKKVLHNGEPEMSNSWLLSDFDGEIGQGDWTLRVSWNSSSGERGRFYSWSLDVGGFVTYSVEGFLIDTETKQPMANVPWVLTGGTMIYQGETDSDGRFHIDGLLSNDYKISFQAPEFSLVNPSQVIFSLMDKDISLGNILLRHDKIQSNISSTFNSSVGDNLFRIENCAFIGSGSGSGERTSLNGTFYGLLQEWHRDVAAFDINRYPKDVFSISSSDTDFFVQPDTPFYRIDKEPVDNSFDTYEILPGTSPDRFRMECTMGGFVFGEVPSHSSGLYLHSFRIEQ